MSKSPRQKRIEAEVLEIIERRKLRLERGPGFVRVRGYGVDVKVRKLAELDARDLEPAH
jgi:hypothetical protein